MKQRFVILIGILLLFFALVWMMFQPLMSAYVEGVLESGEIYVYGIGFLIGFGLQGVLTIIFPFLLILLLCINGRRKYKTRVWLGLIVANVFAYSKSWINAKQWLVAEVNPEIHYYMWTVIYPCMMIITAILVFWWICRYDVEELVDG